jgi:hypothetical protein
VHSRALTGSLFQSCSNSKNGTDDAIVASKSILLKLFLSIIRLVTIHPPNLVLISAVPLVPIPNRAGSITWREGYTWIP